ncbi:hypothetical protein ABT354_36540, partial [Streptomyces sp. NPDC000594]
MNDAGHPQTGGPGGTGGSPGPDGDFDSGSAGGSVSGPVGGTESGAGAAVPPTRRTVLRTTAGVAGAGLALGGLGAV